MPKKQAKKKTKKAAKVKKLVKKPKKAAKPAPETAKVEQPKKPQAKPELAPQSALVKKYQSHKGDTGSTGVQIALLTDRIAELVKHLKKHAKDFDSKRGLLILVGKRRRLLNYLKRTDQKQYELMIQDLGLRK